MPCKGQPASDQVGSRRSSPSSASASRRVRNESLTSGAGGTLTFFESMPMKFPPRSIRFWRYTESRARGDGRIAQQIAVAAVEVIAHLQQIRRPGAPRVPPRPSYPLRIVSTHFRRPARSGSRLRSDLPIPRGYGRASTGRRTPRYTSGRTSTEMSTSRIEVSRRLSSSSGSLLGESSMNAAST